MTPPVAAAGGRTTRHRKDEAWMSFMDRLKGRGRKDRDAAQHEDSSLSGPYSGLEADLRDTVQDSGLGTTVSVPDAIIS